MTDVTFIVVFEHLIILGGEKASFLDRAAASLFICSKDHSCVEAFTVAVISKTNAVKASAAKGLNMNAVAIQMEGDEGEHDSCKPAKIILSSMLSGDTRLEVMARGPTLSR